MSRRTAPGTTKIRGNALCGKGGRGSQALIGMAVAVAMLVTAAPAGAASSSKPFVPKPLLNAASANPTGVFDVVVTGKRGTTVNDVISELRPLSPVLGRKFGLVSGVSARLSGKATPATIAIVDSGVDATHPDVAGSVLTQVNFVTSGTNSDGDGRGHGTFVASVAVGSASGHAGAAPAGKIVSLDVLADDGTGTLSDVLAATQWILDNKNRYGIRVANFSLNAGSGSSFMFDPSTRRSRSSGSTASPSSWRRATTARPPGRAGSSTRPRTIRS